MTFRTAFVLIFTISLLSASSRVSAQAQAKPQRSFEFTYGATVSNVPTGSQIRVWVPIAQDTPHQIVTVKRLVADGEVLWGKDRAYDNSIGYFETAPNANGETVFEFVYNVTRKEASADGTATLTKQQKAQFLKANRLVPTKGRPVELLDGELPDLPIEAGSKLYDIVEKHMKYDKSKLGYGNGDSVWACDSKTGNCTDFHSLFISLARSQSLPARFEIGFPLPTHQTEGSIAGYHCWAWFFVQEKGWTPVDISEADKHPEMKDYYFGKLTPDRVAFSTGRDIELVPPSVAGPLNYFVYPHVEVDGKTWPKEKIKLAFSFRNRKQSDLR